MLRIAPKYDAIIIFAGCLLLFIMGITDQEFINFQTRFAMFAQEMLRNGPSFFPTTYNTPYPDYPATSTFLVYLVSWPLGKVTSFSLIFPTAVTAALIALVTYKIGALQNRLWGWYGVFFLLFTASFLAESRTVALDQYESLITATCFYLVYSTDILNKPKRLYWLPFLFVLGFAFRGPIGLIVPTSIVCGYFLLENQWRRFFTFGFLSAFLLALCFAALLGCAYLDGGQAFLDDVIRMQVSSRVRIVTQNAWYGYFVNGLADYAISYPLAMLIGLGMVPVWWANLPKKSLPMDLDLVKKLFFWVMIVLIGFSFANSKRNHYVLPMAPALALMCGYLFATPEVWLTPYLRTLKKIFLAIFSVFPAICALLIAAAWYYAVQKSFPIEAPVTIAIGICIMLQLISVLYRRHIALRLTMALAAFLTVQLLILEPTNFSLNHTRHFVFDFEAKRHQAGAELGFYNYGRDATAIKFMCNLPPEEIAAGVNPVFIDDIDLLLAQHKKIYFITRPETYAALPNSIQSQLTVLGTSEVGHNEVIIFAVSKNLGKNDVDAFR